MAVGVIAAARQAGVKMPDDVGVAGFDDIITLRDVVPALTTVRIPLYEIGVEAMHRVLDPATRPGVRRVPGSVILRDSTARNLDDAHVSGAPGDPPAHLIPRVGTLHR
jgi:LacI family transcriptional regulator